jgi:hypothetical protein
LSEYDARTQVMQDFENVEKRARLAGYLWVETLQRSMNSLTKESN